MIDAGWRGFKCKSIQLRIWLYTHAKLWTICSMNIDMCRGRPGRCVATQLTRGSPPPHSQRHWGALGSTPSLQNGPALSPCHTTWVSRSSVYWKQKTGRGKYNLWQNTRSIDLAEFHLRTKYCQRAKIQRDTYLQKWNLQTHTYIHTYILTLQNLIHVCTVSSIYHCTLYGTVQKQCNPLSVRLRSNYTSCTH